MKINGLKDRGECDVEVHQYTTANHVNRLWSDTTEHCL